MHHMDKMAQSWAQIERLYIQWAKQKNIHNIHLLWIYRSLFDHANRTQQEICTKFSLSKQTISPLCQDLQRQGMIELSPHIADKREKRWQLTERGRAEITPIMQQMHAWESAAFAQLGASESAQLVKLWAQLAQAMAENVGQFFEQ